jgi:hypothetical protein
MAPMTPIQVPSRIAISVELPISSSVANRCVAMTVSTGCWSR